MREGFSVKEDQLAGLRPDDGAVLFQGIDADRGRIVPDYQLTPACRMVGEEKKSGYRVHIEVALGTHPRPA